MKDTDLITTVLGGVGAVAAAAGPVLNAVQGSLHQGDWTQLVFAAVMALFGYFTNKKGAQ